MSWFKRENGDYDGPEPPDGGDRRVRTEGLWTKCPSCRAVIFKADLEANLNVCPKCQYHFKIGARQRLELLLEPGYTLVDGNLRSTDPLNFTDIKPYKLRLRKAQEEMTARMSEVQSEYIRERLHDIEDVFRRQIVSGCARGRIRCRRRGCARRRAC